MFMRAKLEFLLSSFLVANLIPIAHSMDLRLSDKSEGIAGGARIGRIRRAAEDLLVIEERWTKAKDELFKLSFQEQCNTNAETELTNIKTENRKLFLNDTSITVDSQRILNFLENLVNNKQMYCNYRVNLVCSETTQKCECPKGLEWHKKHGHCLTDYKDKNVLQFTNDIYNKYKQMSKSFYYLSLHENCDYDVDSALFQLVYSYEKYRHQRFDDSEDPVSAFNSLYNCIPSAWTLNLAEKIRPCYRKMGLRCSQKTKKCACSTTEWNHRFVLQGNECRVAKKSICTPSITEDDAYYSSVRYLPAASHCEKGARCVSNVWGKFLNCVNYRPNSNINDYKYRVCRCK